MDRNFHTDDFERLLREKSDEFRMYPSKRIWHSIYNNIHPGRKWPSVAMSITLITALLLMGYLNTRNIGLYKSPGKNTLQQNVIASEVSTQFASRNIFQYSDNANELTVNDGIPKTEIQSGVGSLSVGNNDIPNVDNNNSTTKLSPSTTPTLSPPQSTIADDIAAKNHYADNKTLAPKKSIPSLNTESSPLIALAAKELQSKDDYTSISLPGKSLVSAYPEKISLTYSIGDVVTKGFSPQDIIKNLPVLVPNENVLVEHTDAQPGKKDFISAEDKDWIENYALYNRPAAKKWANKLFWQMYATPSVVYRVLYTDPNFGNAPNTSPLALPSSSQDINKAVNQKPSVGFEIGTGIQYSIFKGIKIKAGLQLNYTRYNSDAFQNTHPFATRLTMHDFKTNTSYEVYRTTPYSNKSGLQSVKLHNETFQISLPMGADFKLIGNENLQWNIGATIQPTYVAAGKSYLISSDRREYVKETSMLNRWNLNAGFETFITYKSKGLTWQLGPQFRTQLFSTNSKRYAVEERLGSYGFKVGVSKTIK